MGEAQKSGFHLHSAALVLLRISTPEKLVSATFEGPTLDLKEILERIDAGAEADEVRLALAVKIMECLQARGDDMTPWERTHYKIAIDLLPSSWLRLTWAHVDCVCNMREPDKGTYDPAFTESAPTKIELLTKMTEALALMHAKYEYDALAQFPVGQQPVKND